MDERAKAMVSLLGSPVTPETFIQPFIDESGISEDKWTKKMWRSLALHLANKCVEQERTLKGLEVFKGHYMEIYKTRRKNHNDGISNRRDQLDKAAYQAAIKDGDYPTIAAAVRDMRANLQWENYPDRTLNKWTKEVWEKPIQIGRPKKRMQSS